MSEDNVVRTPLTWDEKMEKLRRIVAQRYGESQADSYMKYYLRRYGVKKKNYLHWKLCYELLSERKYCRTRGTRWFACVGAGGTGKSTFMSNVFYFLDETFKMSDSKMDIKEFIKSLTDSDVFGKGKALFMDEPDDEIHPQTPVGKALRKVLGKARQGKFFFGICATDLTDIPPYIFRKIDVLFFTPQLGKYIMFSDDPFRRRYVMPALRKAYMENKGYNTLLEMAKTSATCSGWTTDKLPFDLAEKRAYLKNKSQDFHDDIKNLNGLLISKVEMKANVKSETKQRYFKILEDRHFRDGLSLKELAEEIGVTHRTANFLKREYLQMKYNEKKEVNDREAKVNDREVSSIDSSLPRADDIFLDSRTGRFHIKKPKKTNDAKIFKTKTEEL